MVLRTTGLESRQSPFANLADLLHPVIDTLLPGLPEAQADALDVVLGRRPARAPVGETVLEMAVVGSLRQLAHAGVVLAVDDEQWLDDDTRRLLEAAVVRLGAASVRWLLAVRPEHADRGLAQVVLHELADRVTRVELAGLDDAMLTEIVLDRFPGRWSPAVLRQVVTLAAGSPYAALALARETIASGQREGGTVHLPPTLAVSLRSRLERLSPPTLGVVQAAALAGKPTRTLLRAVAFDPVDDRVDEALEAGVLETSPPNPVLRFSHPLLRQAAEDMLTGPGRRRLHRALAAAMDDPDEAAWQLARGADERDDALAAKAEVAAQHAITRGALARAADLSHAAAELTPDPDSLAAWRRRIMWLERLEAIGEFDQVRQQGEKWAPQVPLPARGQLTAVRATVEPDFEAAQVLWAEAFADLADRDPVRAASVGSSLAGHLGVQLGRLAEARTYAAATVIQARAGGEPAVLREAMATDGLLSALAGEADAGDRLRAAVSMPGFANTAFPYNSSETYLAWWHLWRGELALARGLLQKAFELSERLGSDDSAQGIRLHLAEVEWRAGNWDLARVHVQAYMLWSRETGHGQEGAPAYGVALVDAGRGDVERARVLAARGAKHAEAQRDWTFAAQCRWVLGLAELSVDDPAAALRWLGPVADMLQSGGIGEPGCYPFTPDLIEAWAATGKLEEAAERLAWLQQAAQLLDHPWARITAGRAEATLLLAQHKPAAAVEAVTAATAEARELGLPFELGRCLLVLGTAQRKARERRHAAATLDKAIATFAALGAARWQTLAAAQRARLAPGHDSTLTPAEQRIADLVATGHSNPEIAAVMFISVKTVEANLTRIYRKLGLRSRVDLARHKQ
jgi:DNA-binding CsgD family transcriptional regulator